MNIQQYSGLQELYDDEIYKYHKRNADLRDLRNVKLAILSYAKQHPEFCDDRGRLIVLPNQKVENIETGKKEIFFVEYENPDTGKKEYIALGNKLSLWKEEYNKFLNNVETSVTFSKEEWEDLNKKYVMLFDYTQDNQLLNALEALKEENPEVFDENGKIYYKQVFDNYVYYDKILRKAIQYDLTQNLLNFSRRYKKMKNNKTYNSSSDTIEYKKILSYVNLKHFETSNTKYIKDVNNLLNSLKKYRKNNPQNFNEKGFLKFLPEKDYSFLYLNKDYKVKRIEIGKELFKFYNNYESIKKLQQEKEFISSEEWEHLEYLVFLKEKAKEKKDSRDKVKEVVEKAKTKEKHLDNKQKYSSLEQFLFVINAYGKKYKKLKARRKLEILPREDELFTYFDPILNEIVCYPIGKEIQNLKMEYKAFVLGNKTNYSKDEWKKLSTVINFESTKTKKSVFYTPAFIQMEKYLTIYKQQNKNCVDENGKIVVLPRRIDKFDYFDESINQNVEVIIGELVTSFKSSYKNYKAGRKRRTFGASVDEWNALLNLIDLNTYYPRNYNMVEKFSNALQSYKLLYLQSFDESGKLVVFPPRDKKIVYYDKVLKKEISYPIGKYVEQFRINYKKYTNGMNTSFKISQQDWANLEKIVDLKPRVLTDYKPCVQFENAMATYKKISPQSFDENGKLVIFKKSDSFVYYDKVLEKEVSYNLGNRVNRFRVEYRKFKKGQKSIYNMNQEEWSHLSQILDLEDRKIVDAKSVKAKDYVEKSIEKQAKAQKSFNN